jgi:hypothetical protein
MFLYSITGNLFTRAVTPEGQYQLQNGWYMLPLQYTPVSDKVYKKMKTSVHQSISKQVSKATPLTKIRPSEDPS